ncbi:MAG: hypothetical protein JSU69_11120 [Candidatus Zixiibacteriota bacterium]|nr:MAG: hypothetical protein JSU69_11120 [candidate division Zixibacteria bacterium]
MRKTVWIPTTVIAVLAGALIVETSLRTTTLSRDSLIADVRQFTSTVESVHPDPYYNVGGKIEWQRSVQEVISRIPESGMSREEFYWLLCPLVTSLGDAHTWLRSPDKFSSGLPLYLAVAADGIFVAGVPSEEYRTLLGARLISIQGTPIREIIERAYAFVSAENEFQVLRNLGGTGMLFNMWFLDRLVPECQGQENVYVTFSRADGTIMTRTLTCSEYGGLGSYTWITTRCSLPSTERSDFTYTFLDSSKQTALLVVNGLNTYREAFEMWQNEGRFSDCAGEAADLYQRYNSADPPEDDEVAVIAGLPSATETFISMCQEMKQAGTRSLIVDLRRCEGGNSAMAEILTYCLYGKEQLLNIEARQIEVLRCSPTYLERHPGVSLEDISRLQGVTIDTGDYVFDPVELESDREEVDMRFREWAGTMPTFYSEYMSGKYGGYYLPKNVYVLSSVYTFSSGFTVMYYLYRAGATIVGVPSAQAGNCFGEATGFELENSGLHFTVSCKYFENFSDDPAKGRVLFPNYPLTYEIMASYDFDANASLLYAQDLAK